MLTSSWELPPVTPATPGANEMQMVPGGGSGGGISNVLDMEQKKMLGQPPVFTGLMDTPLGATETFLVVIVYVIVPLMLVLCTCVVCAIPWYPRQARLADEEMYAGNYAVV